MDYVSLEYNNLNSLRSYPIRERCSQLSQDGSFSIPTNFIVDSQFSISTDVGRRVYVSSIENAAVSVTVTVKDDNNVLVGTFSINVAAHQQGDVYYLQAQLGGIYERQQGKITVYQMDWVDTNPTGSFHFTINTQEIEPKCVIPSLQQVSKLIFVDNFGDQFQLSGDVTIKANANIRVKSIDGKVYFDVGDGLGLNSSCPSLDNPILTINHIGPDSSGNFTIQGSECMDVTSEQNGILISDHCSKPCSSCDNLEQLVIRATTLESNFMQLRDAIERMNIAFDTYLLTAQTPCSC